MKRGSKGGLSSINKSKKAATVARNNDNETETEEAIEEEGLLPPPPDDMVCELPESVPALLDGDFFKVEVNNKGELEFICQHCPGKKKIRGNLKSTGNFMKHIKLVHPSLAKRASEKRESGKINKNKATNVKTSPSSSTATAKGSMRSYSQSSRSECVTQKQATDSIVDYVVESMLPLQTVEKPAFKTLVACLTAGNPVDISVPYKQSLRAILANRKETMIFNIKDAIKDVDYVCTTADLWSKNKKSFLGVTAHFLVSETLERKSVMLACRRMKFEHSFAKIAEALYSVHEEFDLGSKVTHTVTDNASNFAKAFREYKVVEAGEKVDLAENRTEKGGQKTSNDSDRDGEDDSENSDSDVDIEELDLSKCAEESESFISLPCQLKCAAHTLRLVAVTDCDPKKMKGQLSNAYRNIHEKSFSKLTAFWNKRSRSTYASDVSEQIAGKRFAVPNDTRWNAFYDSTRDVLSKKDKLGELFEKLKLPKLSPNELDFLEEYNALNRPLADALDLLQGENSCFLGNLLPALQVILKTLETMQLKYCSPLRSAIQEGLKKRFKDQLYLSDESSDLFVLATVSHPRFKLTWVPEDQKDRCKNLFLSEVVTMGDNSRKESTDYTSNQSHETDFYSILDQNGSSTGTAESTNTSTSTVEALQYLENPSKALQMLSQFPTVKKVFIKFNTPLPSSAPVERLFSAGGQILIPRRNRLSDENFETMLMLKSNKDFQL